MKNHRLPATLFSFIILTTFAECNFPQKPAAKTTEAGPKKSATVPAKTNLPLYHIKLPAGFKIDVFAEEVENARSLCLSPSGTLFVGTRDKGNVYALRDTDGDFHADEKYILAKGLNMPNGVAFRDGALYVAEVNRILKFDNIEANLANPPPYSVIFDQYPSDRSHGWKYIAFGPDGKLYVPIGAPCNICMSENEIYASITRISPSGRSFEIVQTGVRNTVGFTWHPVSKELWFTDNGRDMLGDDLPADELNHAQSDFLHFGYPFCHQGDVPDPEFGKIRSCNEFTKPAQKLGPHVAALGLEFYTGNQFPQAYAKQIFIAEHGSWNRSNPIGYRVTLVRLDDYHRSISYETFAEGWLQDDGPWGRPVDIELLPDGSMLVSDDFGDAIYRIYYEGS